jgi:hypothetical protein
MAANVEEEFHRTTGRRNGEPYRNQKATAVLKSLLGLAMLANVQEGIRRSTGARNGRKVMWEKMKRSALAITMQTLPERNQNWRPLTTGFECARTMFAELSRMMDSTSSV